MADGSGKPNVIVKEADAAAAEAAREADLSGIRLSRRTTEHLGHLADEFGLARPW